MIIRNFFYIGTLGCLFFSLNLTNADTFKVFQVRGAAKIKKKDGSSVPATTESVLEEGDTIKTEADESVTLVSESEKQNNKIAIKANSEVVCEEQGDGNEIPTFSLKQGSAYCAVISKAKKQGVTFKIKTEVGAAGVTGTEFYVEQNQNGMQVAVAESTVELTDFEGRKVALTPNHAGYIQPWDRAEFIATGTGICPNPPQGTESVLSVSFPLGTDEPTLFSEAQRRFMEHVERLIESVQNPAEKQKMRMMDRVVLFREILPQIQKVELPDRLELRMSLAPILNRLGLAPETKVITDVQPISKVEYSRLFGSQSRLMVERGARVDGYRQLAETVHGMVISSTTQVRDFVAENDEASSQLDTFIRGATLKEFEYFSDGMIQAYVFIDPDLTRNELGRILNKKMGKNAVRSEQGLSSRTLSQFHD